jgi:hypothetical protein
MPVCKESGVKVMSRMLKPESCLLLRVVVNGSFLNKRFPLITIRQNSFVFGNMMR